MAAMVFIIKYLSIYLSIVLIVTCLLKLSTQWVKYALACVYTDLPIGELKKKK